MIQSVDENVINDELTLLDWCDDEGSFGRVTVEYNGEGGFTLDSEYISLDKLTEIMYVWHMTKNVNV